MKKKRQEPVFNIELDHHLRQIIMNRGHLIRGQRTRTVFAIRSRGPKSWIEARLIPTPGEDPVSNWTKAHELASKINLELRTDVYVEPASKHGRFNAISTGQVGDEANDVGGPGHVPNPSPFAGPGFHSGVTGVNGINAGFAGSPMGLGSGFSNMPAISGLQSPNPMAHIAPQLPPEVQQILGAKTSAENGNVKCPALYDLAGWSDLPDNLQKMFETEAAQLIYGGLKLEPDEPVPMHDLTRVDMLQLQPTISRQLKRFLDRATAPAENA
ncbi:MAG: hypothetical protein JST01_22030 [Cyanobacteria bacterium SZAS TMP-1]|nr:hypothetical protein [Cyanobacteria bacterium SZAS TMP-1]